MITPSFDQFKHWAQRYPVVPVTIDVLADALTPLGLFQSHGQRSPQSFLFESVEGGERLGRYSFVSFDPAAVVRINGRPISSNTVGAKNGNRRPPSS